jgi:hypothetical protein
VAVRPIHCWLRSRDQSCVMSSMAWSRLSATA